MEYKLFVNGVDYEDFKTLKELDEYLFEHNITNDNSNIEVKKIRIVRV